MHRGHFEKGGVPILRDMTVNVVNVILGNILSTLVRCGTILATFGDFVVGMICIQYVSMVALARNLD